MASLVANDAVHRDHGSVPEEAPEETIKNFVPDTTGGFAVEFVVRDHGNPSLSWTEDLIGWAVISAGGDDSIRPVVLDDGCPVTTTAYVGLRAYPRAADDVEGTAEMTALAYISLDC
jgi:hypothetical protein